MRWYPAVVTSAVVSIGVLGAAVRLPVADAAAPASPPLPNSIAAIGDSITRAFDACCFYGPHANNSWSTGADRRDGIRSQYERILAGNPGLEGNRFNDAVSGAKMAEG